MADMLRDGLAWLEQQRDTFASSPVTYTQAANETKTGTVNVSVGKSEFNVAEGAVQMRVQTRDYLILAEALAGLEIDAPSPGDLITESINGDDVVYMVASPGEGQPAWRWADANHLTLRIHTLLENKDD